MFTVILCWSELERTTETGHKSGFRIFGQVINKVGNIANIGHKWVGVLGSGPHTPTQFFWEYPTSFILEPNSLSRELNR